MRKQTTKGSKQMVAGLTLGALGVVFGDIGTSPLYAVNEMFFGRAHVMRSEQTILSLISLVVWALMVVIAFKYVWWVLGADNDGEGGVFALLALLKRYRARSVAALSIVLIFAAGLLFGDGTITPAISVLSAVEGLRVVTPAFDPYIIPITLTVLTALFAVQSRGTHKIGRLFGPIILCWFVVIATLGLRQVLAAPGILAAFNPIYAAQAFRLFPLSQLMLILGSVVLVVAGGEALYADMGHFGRLPIRISWFAVVMPCLLLNYLGQGAYLLAGKEVVADNLFYSLVPSQLLLPMVLLASMATVIASQALISGAFSLTTQGIALGLLPRLHIKHTHEAHEGQIYIPYVNWALYAGCVSLVITFGSAAHLASAYGLAESGVMVATTLSMFMVSRKLWGWSPLRAVIVFVPLLMIDSLFLTSNSLKLLQGGFVPLTIGILLYIVMTTWQWGRNHWRATLRSHRTLTMGEVLKQKQQQKGSLERSLLVLSHEAQPKAKQDLAPALLQIFMKRYHLLPRHVISLTIRQTRKPYVDEADRYQIVQFENNHAKGASLLAITASFGFMEEPNVEQVIADIAADDQLTPNDDMRDWIIYVARTRVVARRKRRHSSWLIRSRALLYSFLVTNATPTYEYYGLGDDARVSAELLPLNITS